MWNISKAFTEHVLAEITNYGATGTCLSAIDNFASAHPIIPGHSAYALWPWTTFVVSRHCPMFQIT